MASTSGRYTNRNKTLEKTKRNPPFFHDAGHVRRKLRPLRRQIRGTAPTKRHRNIQQSGVRQKPPHRLNSYAAFPRSRYCAYDSKIEAISDASGETNIVT